MALTLLPWLSFLMSWLPSFSHLLISVKFISSKINKSLLLSIHLSRRRQAYRLSTQRALYQALHRPQHQQQLLLAHQAHQRLFLACLKAGIRSCLLQGSLPIMRHMVQVPQWTCLTCQTVCLKSRSQSLEEPNRASSSHLVHLSPSLETIVSRFSRYQRNEWQYFICARGSLSGAFLWHVSFKSVGYVWEDMCHHLRTALLCDTFSHNFMLK